MGYISKLYLSTFNKHFEIINLPQIVKAHKLPREKLLKMMVTAIFLSQIYISNTPNSSGTAAFQ